MQRDDVRPREQLVQLHLLDVQRARFPCIQVGIVQQHLDVERPQQAPHFAAHVAGADDADEQVLLVHRNVGGPPPAVVTQVKGILQQPLAAHDHQPQGGLRHVVADLDGGGEHADAARRDVVVPHLGEHVPHRAGGVGNDLEPVGRLHDRGSEPHGATRAQRARVGSPPTGDQPVAAANASAHLGLIEILVAVVAVHVEVLLQLLQCLRCKHFDRMFAGRGEKQARLAHAVAWVKGRGPCISGL